ncbi:MAG: hypothetical protein Q7T39_07470 [Polaromonas sp.]|nr:hypothetical protein [Polaromonas sp.]
MNKKAPSPIGTYANSYHFHSKSDTYADRSGPVPSSLGIKVTHWVTCVLERSTWQTGINTFRASQAKPDAPV